MDTVDNVRTDCKRLGRPTHRRATPTNTTPAQRARYVAESITLRHDAGIAWSWREYGLDEKPEQRWLVEQALAALR